MHATNARPGFGTKLKQPDYYVQTRAFIESLRPTTTLRGIATLLNKHGYRTPKDLPFDRQGVANFIRNTAV